MVCVCVKLGCFASDLSKSLFFYTYPVARNLKAQRLIYPVTDILMQFFLYSLRKIDHDPGKRNPEKRAGHGTAGLLPVVTHNIELAVSSGTCKDLLVGEKKLKMPICFTWLKSLTTTKNPY
ncbi:hypothetical protein AMECASPLE_024165 [Ameca splendens]|uniref:Uncharacterized protein n=1 Tax=Ameca splendens TaxID=208324 RepID=A0ABV1A055_9TELE